MKHLDSPEINRYLHANLLPLFEELTRKKKTGIEYSESTICYLLKAGKHLDKETVIRKFQELPENNASKEIAMTAAKQLFQKSMQQGMLMSETQHNFSMRIVRDVLQSLFQEMKKKKEPVSCLKSHFQSGQSGDQTSRL